MKLSPLTKPHYNRGETYVDMSSTAISKLPRVPARTVSKSATAAAGAVELDIGRMGNQIWTQSSWASSLLLYPRGSRPSDRLHCVMCIAGREGCQGAGVSAGDPQADSGNQGVHCLILGSRLGVDMPVAREPRPRAALVERVPVRWRALPCFYPEPAG
jgi:hypothetical protein